MLRRKLVHPLLIALLVAVPALSLAGCGADEAPQPQPDDPAWSDPAGERATGSPDGEAGALRTAGSLLQNLRERVRVGRVRGDAGFDQDVESVAAVLWAPDAEGADRSAAQVHMQLAVIAGDVGRALAAEPPEDVDATEKKIHAAWTAAASGSAEHYRAWCSQEGAILMKERAEALRARFFPNK